TTLACSSLLTVLSSALTDCNRSLEVSSSSLVDCSSSFTDCISSCAERSSSLEVSSSSIVVCRYSSLVRNSCFSLTMYASRSVLSAAAPSTASTAASVDCLGSAANSSSKMTRNRPG